MSYPGVLVAVGDDESKKSEKFEDGSWTDIEEIPVSGSSMRWQVAVFYAGNHYYFGGWSNGIGFLNSILRLSGTLWTWSNVGNLNSARLGHGVILVI